MRIIRAKKRHCRLITKIAEKGNLIKYPSWLYKFMIVSLIGYIFIVVHKDKPAGFLFATPLLGSAYVHQIGILPEFRNKGLGTLLLKKSFQRFKLFNFKSVVLSVKNSNRRAYGWYKKHGFSRCNSINKFWRPLISQTLLKFSLRK